MAIKLNVRLLLLSLVIVALFNFGELYVQLKNDRERSKHTVPPVAIVEIKQNPKQVLKSINKAIKSLIVDSSSPDSISANATLKEDNKSPLSTSSPVDNDTCANTDTYLTETVEDLIDLCPQIPPGLGAENYSLSTAQGTVSEEVQPGGLWKPSSCLARQQVAVIVPFRGPNKKQLHSFLQHMHAFLMKQQANYQIFVVEYEKDVDDDSFNRGHLYNVGVTEAQKQRGDWQCLVLHDPYLVPIDSRNLYRCSWYPRQLVATVESVDGLGTKYHPMVGGGIAVTPEQYAKVNGFTNSFLGRDCDYIDFYNRLQWNNLTLERSDPSIGIYRTIGPQPDMNDTFHSVVMTPFHLLDGLTSLSYDLGEIGMKKLYTNIKVGVNSQEQTGILLSKILGTVMSNGNTKE